MKNSIISLIALALIICASVHAAEDTVNSPSILQTIQNSIVDLASNIVLQLTGKDITVTIIGTHRKDPELGSPRIDLTPKIFEKPVSLKDDNQNRKSAVVAEVSAPTEAQLPPFRENFNDKLDSEISRGVVFNIGAPFITATDTKSPSNLYQRITDKNLIDAIGQNPTVPYRVILIQKPKQVTADQGERYGRLIIAQKSLLDLANIDGSKNSPYAYITIDEPISIEATDVDQLIQGPLARQSTGSQGAVGVCIIDTGLAYTNSRFSSNYVGGYDFVNNDSDPSDDNGHGTAMADQILNVAPGAQLYIAKVLDSKGNGYESDAIKAIDWCMLQNVAVISMSTGEGRYASWCDDSLLAQKANEAVARGFFVAAAAGNDGNGTMRSPACGSLVTSVAATDTTSSTEQVWSSASLTNVTDLLAPGVGADLLTQTGTKTSLSGSSVSAAATAGAAAVLIEANSFLPQQTQDSLRSSGIIMNTTYGLMPRLDLYAAVTNQTNNLDLNQTGFESPNQLPGGNLQALGSCGSPACPGGVGQCSNACSVGSILCTVTGCSASVCQFSASDCSTSTCMTCVGGSCDIAPAGTDPGSHCGGAGSYVCTGEIITDNGLCGEDGSCGYEETTCADTEASTCKIGHSSCWDGCTDGVDNDGNGLIDGCDSTVCTGSKGTGTACFCDADCSSSSCDKNYYQGSLTGTYCAPNTTYCIASNGTAYANGGVASTNTCYSSTVGSSAWIASQGQWIIRNTTGSTLAILDKYGSMVIRGNYFVGQTVFDNGWIWKNSTGSVVGSINSSNGQLKMRTASAVTEGGSPSGSGVKITNSAGAVQGIFSKTGAVTIKGDFAYNITTLP